MKTNISDLQKTYTSIPETWVINGVRTDGYNTLTANHFNDGWRDVVEPTLTSTQKYGVIILTNDIASYSVVEKSDLELQNEVLNNYNISNSEAILKAQTDAVVNQAQTLTDTDALNNKDIYPLWKSGIAVKVGEKYNAFSGTDLKLYKVNQAHTTQDNWQPSVTQALFTEIAPAGTIPKWKQPTGAQDAYAIGDKVYYVEIGEQIWQSKIAANTTVPNGDIPFNRYWQPL